MIIAMYWRRSRSVISDSLRPRGRQPTRLYHPWNFPGKNTGMGCHFLLHRHVLIIPYYSVFAFLISSCIQVHDYYIYAWWIFLFNMQWPFILIKESLWSSICSMGITYINFLFPFLGSFIFGISIKSMCNLVFYSNFSLSFNKEDQFIYM